MSSHTYAAPLAIQPEASRRLAVALIAMHAGAAVAPFLVSLPLPLSAALAAFVLISLHHAWRGHLGGRRVIAAVWREDGSWQLTTADHRCFDATLVPQGYVSAYAVVLCFRGTQGGRRALVILPDSLDAEAFRRLRVRLRLVAASPIPEPQPGQ